MLMRKTPTVVILAGLLAGCSNEIPGESRLPRCEPRSQVDPVRLNIDSTAEDYAVVKPSRAGEGKGIECPAVRLKTSYVFEDLTIDASCLDVCFD